MGELLARLDAADVTATLGVSEAAVRQSEAALKQAEANLVLAQAQQAQADADLRRTQGLAAQGFVSPQSTEAAQTRARTAAAATAAAEAGRATAQAGVGQARAQVKVQQVNRDSTEIRAPFDGVVLVKNANVGDLITPFSNAVGTSGAVVTLADLSTLEVEADVSESNVGKVRVDQPVEITLDALPEARFRGSVARIVPTVDRAKATLMTKVRFERLDPRVLPEMSAKVNFLSQAPSEAEQKPVLALPAKAIAEREGRKLVFRIGAGDLLEAVPVTPGRLLGDLVEIAPGPLQRGDRVVLSPAAALEAGRAVVVAGQ
jgi:HlyD family secretion protein